jgi:hypothetical protein
MDIPIRYSGESKEMTTATDKIINIVVAIMMVAVTGSSVATAWRFYNPPPKMMPGAQQFAIGDKLEATLPVKFSDAEHTLVMLVQAGCQYCTASMPFYKELMEARGSSPSRVRIVAIATNNLDATTSYLSVHGVEPDAILPMPSAWLGRVGTPTLVSVNKAGEVSGVWLGQLQADQEKTVKQALFGA